MVQNIITSTQTLNLDPYLKNVITCELIPKLFLCLTCWNINQSIPADINVRLNSYKVIQLILM